MTRTIVDWAVETGRILERERASWEERLLASPSVTDRILRTLTPMAAGGTAVRTVPNVGLGGELPQPKPTPALFPNGKDVPDTTASGIPPAEVGKAAIQARRLIASEPDLATAHQLLQLYSGPDGELNAELDAMGNGPLAESWADHLADMKAADEGLLAAEHRRASEAAHDQRAAEVDELRQQLGGDQE